MSVLGEVIAELSEGLPGGGLGAWWFPCPERVPIAADVLYQLLEDISEDDWTVRAVQPHEIPWYWAERLGATPGAPHHYELLEASGMNAMQFCDFWWALVHDPKYPTDRTERQRLFHRLKKFACRIVLDAMHPELVAHGETFGVIPEQMVEHGLVPLQAFELVYERNQRGIPWRLA